MTVLTNNAKDGINQESTLKNFTDEQIEEFYLETMEGFCLKDCGKSSADAEEFYQVTLKTFKAGFNCCENNI